MVVCDAGGGTVDLISYKITNLKPLQVVESAQGEGGLCGGAYVNARFEAHVKARLGEDRLNRYKLQKPKAWRMSLDYFEERVKRWFGATSMDIFEVPFPGLPDDEEAGIEDNCMILTTQQVKQIFDKIMQDITVLVDHQVQALQGYGEKVSAIICVGGLGQSAYLLQHLKAYFQTDLPPMYSSVSNSGSARASVPDSENRAIEVMVSTDSWTACVRGALQRGLQDSFVISRKCRYAYGSSYDDYFQEGVHPISSRYWCNIQEKWMARSVMRWYVTKGETIVNERKVSFSFRRIWKRDLQGQSNSIVSDPIYASTATLVPRMVSDTSVSKVCTLTSDLATVPPGCYKKTYNPSRQTVWTLEYDLVMRINSANIEFSLEIAGQPYGSVSASFDHIQ